MILMNPEAKEKLEGIFGDRVRFDRDEALVYSHDLATLPDPVNLLIKTVPDAVVLPKSTEEIVKLIKIAGEFGIPVVPRGAGSGVYGGALPVDGGIVVDMSFMNSIIEIDEENMIAIVEPGVVWKDLEHEINKRGLSLRVYPTSAPSATVGGWVAQGGWGVGSLTYGSVVDNIEELEFVDGLGEIRVIRNRMKLDLVAECEGITGIITKVAIKLKSLEDMVPIVVQFPSATALSMVIERILAEMNPYTLNFATPKFIKMKQEATGHRSLDEKYTAMFVFTEEEYGRVKETFSAIVAEYLGIIHEGEVAIEEWNERFYPMRLKRLGPTVIPSEAIIPIGNLGDFLMAV
jgi:FAD/FMN-containing dehydrogenase